MKINILHLVLWIIGGLLAALSIAYGISFAVSYISFVNGATYVFRAGLHRNLLITLLIFDFLYLIALAVFFILRKKGIKKKVKIKSK